MGVLNFSDFKSLLGKEGHQLIESFKNIIHTHFGNTALNKPIKFENPFIYTISY